MSMPGGEKGSSESGSGLPCFTPREEKRLEIKVQNDQIESAIKSLKRQLIKDGILKELKNRRSYEKPSVRKKRKQREARRRRQKAARKFSR
jgi:small subunit ribosomal protein S21